MPTAVSPTPTGCAETNGSIEKGVVATALLDKPMRYNVYLPPCYTAETEQRYPVLFLLHGQNFDEQQWLRIGAASAADRLIAAGEVPPFIIVMPFDYSYKQPTQYRFEEVFLDLLIPQIDRAYRTISDAPHRAIGGLSRGGAWAIHLGIRHPDLFGAVGAHSPAIFYSDMDTMPVRLRDANKEHFPRIFIDIGDHDSEYETARPFAELLNEMNIPHEWHEYVGFHDEKYWSAHVEEYLRWYAGGWQ
jgi:enterochelin esterase-like enzyme